MMAAKHFDFDIIFQGFSSAGRGRGVVIQPNNLGAPVGVGARGEFPVIFWTSFRCQGEVVVRRWLEVGWVMILRSLTVMAVGHRNKQ